MARLDTNVWCAEKKKACAKKCTCPDCPYRDKRPPSARRGYGNAWRKVREEVLAAHGIPREQWPLYDVDHRPAYNPAIEPDHRKYTLVPMLHRDHSQKTAIYDTKRDCNGSFAKK